MFPSGPGAIHAGVPAGTSKRWSLSPAAGAAWAKARARRRVAAAPTSVLMMGSTQQIRRRCCNPDPVARMASHAPPRRPRAVHRRGGRGARGLPGRDPHTRAPSVGRIAVRRGRVPHDRPAVVERRGALPRPLRPEGPVPLRVVRPAQRRAAEHDPGRQDRVRGRLPRLRRPDVGTRAEAPRRPRDMVRDARLRDRGVLRRVRGAGPQRRPVGADRPRRERGPRRPPPLRRLAGLGRGRRRRARPARGDQAAPCGDGPVRRASCSPCGRRGAGARSCWRPAPSPPCSSRRWSRSPSAAVSATCASS